MSTRTRRCPPRPHRSMSRCVTYTHVIYALHSLAVLIGVTHLPHHRRQLHRRAALDRRGDHELRAPLGDPRHLPRIALPLADPHLLVRGAVEPWCARCAHASPSSAFRWRIARSVRAGHLDRLPRGARLARAARQAADVRMKHRGPEAAGAVAVGALLALQAADRRVRCTCRTRSAGGHRLRRSRPAAVAAGATGVRDTAEPGTERRRRRKNETTRRPARLRGDCRRSACASGRAAASRRRCRETPPLERRRAPPGALLASPSAPSADRASGRDRAPDRARARKVPASRRSRVRRRPRRRPGMPRSRCRGRCRACR